MLPSPFLADAHSGSRPVMAVRDIDTVDPRENICDLSDHSLIRDLPSSVAHPVL